MNAPNPQPTPSAHSEPTPRAPASRCAWRSLLWIGAVFCGLAGLAAGTITGHVRDRNWYAQYATHPFGVGYYEYAVNASGGDALSTGYFGADDTDVHGAFQLSNLPAGVYHVASWDVWWRSAYAFHVQVPAVGTAPPVDLRLGATMWGYPAFWDDAGYYEFGQTFVATGPISMIYLRCPFNTTYTLTVHTNGPGGPQIGVARTFGSGDQRPIYGYGDMPTVAGGRYYVRIRTASPAIGGVIMQMDPRPDYADPMPGGCLHLGTAQGVQAYPDRDLGLIIQSDDDGLLTNLYARRSGDSLTAARVGQTLVARGSSLVSAAFWLADPSAPVYEIAVYAGGPGGERIGPSRRGRPARVTADPEMLVVWGPGECPLIAGQTYYIEITRVDGGVVNSAYANRANPYAYGQAYQNGVALPGVDLAGTLLEEQSPGSATQAPVRITSEVAVLEADRGTNQLTIRWTTDVPADSEVAIAEWFPPYARTIRDPALTTSHAVTVTGLRAHALHHFRAGSGAAGYRPAVSRDYVICTRPAGPNLLANPGFEEGMGSSPRRTIPGWTKTEGVDIAASDGSWFWGLEPHSGAWLLEGAVNGSSSEGYLYQRLPAEAGLEYAFSAWVQTAHRENDTWKYDVWNDRGRLIHMRLGIDPTGGSNPEAATVRWTPRMYSHRHYCNLAVKAIAQSSLITVFIAMKGLGGQWHLYGVDDCVLTPVSPMPPRFIATRYHPGEGLDLEAVGDDGAPWRLEVSSDLSEWLTLANGEFENGRLQYTDADAIQSMRRYYRLVVP